MSCRFCDRTDTRHYLNGDVCPDHTPAAQAGRPEPPEIPSELQARFLWQDRLPTLRTRRPKRGTP